MLKILRRLFNMDQFRLIILMLSVFILAACSPSSDKSISDPEPSDTTAPVITAISPEGDEVGFEVDGQIRIEFSELVNEESITEQSSINLYTATIEGEDTILYEADSSVVISKEINRGEQLDEATGVSSSADVTVLYVTPSEGRFALNSRYVISVESTLHDLVEDDEDTSVDERNYFDGPRAVSFSTASGSWKDLGPTKELASKDENSAKEIVKPITLPVTVSNKSGDLFYARVSNNTDLYVSKFSHESNNWLNGTEEVADSCANWSESTIGKGCVNSHLVYEGNGDTISSVKMSVSEDHAVLTWLKSSSFAGNKSLWISVYKDGVWSEAASVNMVFFGDDDSIDVNKHSISLNKDRAIIVWRSFEPVEINDVTVQSEVVRVVNFDVNEAVESGNTNFGVPEIIISQPLEVNGDNEIVDDGDVSNVEAVWLNSSTGIVLWTRYFEAGGISQIYEKELSLITADENDETSSDRFVWSDDRLVDRYEFASDRAAGNNVVSFKPVVDSKGDLSLLWKKFDGRLDNLWFAKRVQGIWSTSEKLENNQAGSVYDYVAVFNSKDQIMIAWTQTNQDGEITVYYKSRHSGSNEEVNEEIFSSDSIRGLTLLSDYEGNGHLFWIEKNSSNNVISTSFFSTISETWSEVSELTSSEQGSEVKEINLSTLYRDGRVLMLWNEVGYDNQNINQLIFE